MENNELINVKELIIYHNLDDGFFDNIQSYELIQIVVKDRNRYMYRQELPRMEQIIRLHYDLKINLEGIEVISHMLDKIENLQLTVRNLQNKLLLYE